MAHAVTRGRPEIDRTVRGVVEILSRRHIADLMSSLLFHQHEGPKAADFGIAAPAGFESKDQAKIIGLAYDDRIELSNPQVADLLAAIRSDPTADHTLIDAVAAHERDLLLAVFDEPRGIMPVGKNDWAIQLGRLNGMIINAAGDAKVAQHESKLAHQERMMAIFDTVTSLIPANKALKISSLPVIDAPGKFKHALIPTPSRQGLLDSIESIKDEARSCQRAAIVTAAYEKGRFGVPANVRRQLEQSLPKGPSGKTIPSFFDTAGNITPYSRLDEMQRGAFNAWVGGPTVKRLLGPALTDASLTMFEEIHDR
jgi:hypothetical protein